MDGADSGEVEFEIEMAFPEGTSETEAETVTRRAFDRWLALSESLRSKRDYARFLSAIDGSGQQFPDAWADEFTLDELKRFAAKAYMQENIRSFYRGAAQAAKSLH
jgi:hypothetical protein